MLRAKRMDIQDIHKVQSYEKQKNLHDLHRLANLTDVRFNTSSYGSYIQGLRC